MHLKRILIPVVLFLLLLPIGAVLANDELIIEFEADSTCSEVAFTIDVQDGLGPYMLEVHFGDGDDPLEAEVPAFPFDSSHVYPAQGEYEFSIKVTDSGGLEGERQELILIEGPQVTLESDPSPPLLTLVAGEVTANFIAEVNGNAADFTYTWDLDGDGNDEEVDPTSNTSSFTYTSAGNFEARVTVTDGCGFSESDTLTVVVLDLDETDESDQACHPTAQRIADAVTSLLPDQLAEKIYSCEEIFAFFRGELTGSQLGFGRMWRAYKMALMIDEMTWEDILDWRLQGTGWGLLNQLNKFADALDEVSITDLIKRIESGENTVQDIRSALRAVLRNEADFEDALVRIASGMSSGELNQFYRLAQYAELDPAELDSYLADGTSLSELRHAIKFSESSGESWEEIIAAHNDGYGWGAIKQAYRLADETDDAGTILELGVQEYRRQLREEESATRSVERDQQIASRIAEQFGVNEADVLTIYSIECDENWSCVRKQLREQASAESSNDREGRTASRLAAQFGVSEEQVLEQYELCGADWGCVRAHFRDQAKSERSKGKKK